MIAHRDDIETYRREQGLLASTWTNLGRAACSITVGLHRIQLAPRSRRPSTDTVTPPATCLAPV